MNAGAGRGAGRRLNRAASVSGASAVVVLVFGEACGGGVRCACHLFVLVRTCTVFATACRSLSMAFCESEQLMHTAINLSHGHQLKSPSAQPCTLRWV